MVEIFNKKVVLILFMLFTVLFTSYSEVYRTIYVNAERPNDDGDGYTPLTAKKTLYGAQEAVRKINMAMTGDIEVIISGGTYYTDGRSYEQEKSKYDLGQVDHINSASYRFDQRDSGFNGHYVIYRNAPGEKVILSAGRKIETTWINTAPNIYASNSNIDWYFRQLYINGEQRLLPKTDFVEKKGIYFSQKFNIGGIEKTYHGIKIPREYFKRWEANHLPEIMTIEKWSSKIFKINKAAWVDFFKDYSVDNYYYIPVLSPTTGYINQERVNREGDEHKVSFCFLNSGNWFTDGSFYRESNGQIYYRVNPGEDPLTMEVVAPLDTRLIEFKKVTLEDPELTNKKITNVQFFGLSFQHTNWYRPETWGYAIEQANALNPYISGPSLEASEDTYTKDYINPVIPGAVILENTRDIIFKGNRFENLGADGLELYRDVHNTTVVDCYFTDIAGGALSIYTYGITHRLAAGFVTEYIPGVDKNGDNVLIPIYPYRNVFDEENHVSGNKIINNLIENIGTEYYGSCGIFMVYGKNNLIQNNTLRNLPYSGISLGWGWTTDEAAPISGNVVKYNKIHNILTLLHDGAGIYTLGNHDDGDGIGGTKIYENYIYDTKESVLAESGPYVGLYFDEGSSGISAYYNVFSDIRYIEYDKDTGISTLKNPFYNCHNHKDDPNKHDDLSCNRGGIYVSNNFNDKTDNHTNYIKSKAGITKDNIYYENLHNVEFKENNIFTNEMYTISATDISRTISKLSTQMADINNDGLLDMFVSWRRPNGKSNDVYVFFNNGSGFTPAPESYWILAEDINEETPSTFTFQLVDINNDDHLDIVINWDRPNDKGSNIYTFMHKKESSSTNAYKGLGFIKTHYEKKYSKLSNQISETPSPMSVQFADMNSDGFPEMVINRKHPNYSGNDIYTFYNHPINGLAKDFSPAYSKLSNQISGTPSPMSAQFADMNSDGFPEMIVNWKHPNNLGNDIYTFYNHPINGLAKDFSPAYSKLSKQISGIPSPMSAQFADMNSDGFPEMIVNWKHPYDSGNDIYTFYNHPINGLTKDFSPAYSKLSKQISGTPSPISAQFADMNSDGFIDMVINWKHPNYSRNDIYTYLNDPTNGLEKESFKGHSIESKDINKIPRPMTSQIADINDDGTMDLIISYLIPDKTGSDIYIRLGY